MRRTPRPAPRRLTLEHLEDRTAPAAGALDNTWGGDGRASTGFDLGGTRSDWATAVVTDQFGRITVAGYAAANSGDVEFAVVRYLPNSVLDTSFGGDGRVTIEFDVGGNLIDRAQAIAIDDQGRVVVAGYAQVSSTNWDFAVARLNTDGSLDSSFSADGKATAAFNAGGSFNDRANAVAIDSRGRIVLGGFAQSSATDFEFAVARFTPNGALDTTFSSDGKTTVAYDIGGNKVDGAEALAIDAADRITLAGYAQVSSTNYDFAVARLTATGGLDTTYSSDGKVVIPFNIGAGSNDRATSMAFDGRGQVVLGGYAQSGTAADYEFAAARLTLTGDLDVTFGGDGRATMAFDIAGGLEDRAQAVAVDARGRVILAGHSQTGVSNFDFAVARFRENGSPDTSFSGDGRTTVAFNSGGNFDDRAEGFALDRYGSMVAVGHSELSGGNFNFSVARLQPDQITGTLENTFDEDGKTTTAFDEQDPLKDDSAEAVATDARGRTVVAGNAQVGTQFYVGVARYLADGSLDSTFSGDGKVNVLLPNADTTGVAVDSLGRTVVVGSALVSGDNDFFAIRLTQTGALDKTFSGDGITFIDFDPNVVADSHAQGVAIDANGRIVLGGYTYIGGFPRFAAARLTTAGVLDTTFDADGKATVAFTGVGDTAFAYSVAVDRSNRVVLGGEVFSDATQNYEFAAARLTAAGALDPEFSDDGRVNFRFTTGANDASFANKVVIDPQGRVVLAGSANINSFSQRFAVARLTGTGILDTSFSSDGKAVVQFDNGFATDAIANSAAIDGYGRIVLAGYAPEDEAGEFDSVFGMAVLLTNGTLDTSFGGDGKLTIDIDGESEDTDDEARAVVIDSSGRAVLAGVARILLGSPTDFSDEFAVAVVR